MTDQTEQRELYASMVAAVSKKVKKGEIRNTVLRQIKTLSKSMDILGQGSAIKSDEAEKTKDPEKANKLREQISIIERGRTQIQKAIDVLNRYRKITITSAREHGREQLGRLGYQSEDARRWPDLGRG